MAPISRDIFEQIVEAAPSAILMAGPDGAIRLVNAEAERLFGHPRAELLGEALSALLPELPGDRPSGRPFGTARDLRARTKDGREVPVEIRLAPIETAEGVSILATVVDVTARERAEARFRVAVESSPNAIAMVDASGVIVLVNAEFERLFAYERAEILGHRIERVIPERYRGHHPSFRAAFGRDARPRAMGEGRDLFGLRSDGVEIPLSIGLAPIETHEGLFVLASIIDIAERRRAEERFRLAVESAPNAMIMVDAAGEIVLVNSRAEQIFGYPADAMVGEPIELLVPSRYRAQHGHHRSGFFGAPEARNMGGGRDLFALRADGTEFPVEIGLNPIDTREGGFVLAAIIDITDRKRAEEMRTLATLRLERTNAELGEAKRRLERAVVELERRNRELDEFAHAISHDLKGPLRGIDNLASWLREDVAERLPAEPRAWIEQIGERVLHMNRMLDDLLDYARALMAPGSLEPFELSAVLDAVVAALDVPPSFSLALGPSPPKITTHRVPFEQVLRNLIENSVKHHDRGAGRIEIRVSFTNGAALDVEVADDGPGIPEDLRERVFGLFRSLSKGKEKGSGLGLAIVRRIIESRGGRILAVDNVPRGTIMRFSWPLGGDGWST